MPMPSPRYYVEGGGPRPLRRRRRRPPRPCARRSRREPNNFVTWTLLGDIAVREGDLSGGEGATMPAHTRSTRGIRRCAALSVDPRAATPIAAILVRCGRSARFSPRQSCSPAPAPRSRRRGHAAPDRPGRVRRSEHPGRQGIRPPAAAGARHRVAAAIGRRATRAPGAVRRRGSPPASPPAAASGEARGKATRSARASAMPGRRHAPRP